MQSIAACQYLKAWFFELYLWNLVFKMGWHVLQQIVLKSDNIGFCLNSNHMRVTVACFF